MGPGVSHTGPHFCDKKTGHLRRDGLLTKQHYSPQSLSALYYCAHLTAICMAGFSSLTFLGSVIFNSPSW